MIEEPYRWLEAVSNRREYVRDQLKGGSPVAAVSLPEGILLLGVGNQQSKVFEIFDRQGMAAIGHPADIEKIRQAAIDAAHMEAFTRAPDDVSLRRLVAFGLSSLLKTNFEQIFSAPILAEALFAELTTTPEKDLFLRLRFDGSFDVQHGGTVVLATTREAEEAAAKWFTPADAKSAVAKFVRLYWHLSTNTPLESDKAPGASEILKGKTLEGALLRRGGNSEAKYQQLSEQEMLSDGIK